MLPCTSQIQQPLLHTAARHECSSVPVPSLSDTNLASPTTGPAGVPNVPSPDHNWAGGSVRRPCYNVPCTTCPDIASGLQQSDALLHLNGSRCCRFRQCSNVPSPDHIQAGGSVRRPCYSVPCSGWPAPSSPFRCLQHLRHFRAPLLWQCSNVPCYQRNSVTAKSSSTHTGTFAGKEGYLSMVLAWFCPSGSV